MNDTQNIEEKGLKGFFKRLKAGMLNIGGKAENVMSKIPLLRKVTTLPQKKKRIAYIAMGLVVVLGASFAFSGILKGSEVKLEYVEYTVARGDVETTISGSGTVTPIEQYEIKTLVQGDVLEDTFLEGDMVEEGDILYVIDSEEMENTLEKADISLEKQQMSYNNSLKAYAGLTVTAPIAGKVDEIYVSKGDDVQTGSRIARIVSDKTMTATVPFTEVDAQSLYTGQSVSVIVENTFENLSGKITKIYNSKRTLDGYVTVTDVDIELTNPGYLQTGTYISVTAGNVSCYDPAPLEASTSKIVKAETSGTVESVIVEGTSLVRGGTIATLSSDDAADSLRSSQLSLRESQLSYENTQKQLDDYTITAPISGSVIEKSIKAGDTLEDSSTVLAVIADMSVMTFEISVDELDISSLEVGQEVKITADALPDKIFTGYVDNVGLLGTSSQGVTSYPVTIVIEEPDGLWPGMNVTGEIVTESQKDVLIIPVDAVNRGNTVLVKDGTKDGAELKSEENMPNMPQGDMPNQPNGDTKNQPDNANANSDIPSGFSYTKVTLGINNDSYIAVEAGLKEGAVILVPQIQVEASSSSEEAMMPGGMQGGGMPGGGGMPSGGGMPGGGGGGMPSGGGMPGM